MPTLEVKILEQVCCYFNITTEQLLRKTRKEPLPLIRKIASYFLRKYTLLTWTQIANAVGLTHHATPIHHYKDCNYWLNNADNNRWFVFEKIYLKELEEKIINIIPE